MHGVIQLAQPFFQQHHEGDGGDGLTHGIDAKHCIPMHGPTALQFQVSLRFEISNVTVAGHKGQGAGEVPIVDVALKMSTYAVRGDQMRGRLLPV